MGIFSTFKSTDNRNYEELLIEGERIELISQLKSDQICFTNKRVIFFDNKAFSKRKVRVFLPYKHIEGFAIQEAGVFDLETCLFLLAKGKTFELDFAKDTDMNKIQAILTKYIWS